MLKAFGQLLKAFFSIWQIFEPTLTKYLRYWINFHCCKWPNIENNLAIQVTLFQSELLRKDIKDSNRVKLQKKGEEKE